MLGKSLLSLLLISIPVARNKPAHIPSIELDGIGESSVAFENHKDQTEILGNVAQRIPQESSSASEYGKQVAENLNRLREDQKEFSGFKTELDSQLTWTEVPHYYNLRAARLEALKIFEESYETISFLIQSRISKLGSLDESHDDEKIGDSNLAHKEIINS
ncbi:hypothetical protein PCASD_08705 [Puccinia coronata f. sp. avenae]|uniref:Uncharacterized protein n=1 Tax=Puccinia coronata f. sp. avenae TaxID=200324 RepID=A0A2N5UG63_9BASI|nr:hypothetical protein PCASD_17782 [Puccinia coronata f. sp. avenae]PLW36721.1 hypothetical protein PCASD_08705 [Puccinia coronata f. sp. avenae]